MVVLAQSVDDSLAALHKLSFGEIVLEGVDEPVTPDAVLGVHRVTLPANRGAVVQAAVEARHQFDSRVVAAEFLGFQHRPHCVVLIARKPVPFQAALKPVKAAVVAGVRYRPRAYNADARAALGCPSPPDAAVVVTPRVGSARLAGLERRIREDRTATVADGLSTGSPADSLPRLASRSPSAMLIGAWAAQLRGAVCAALCATVLAKPLRDSPRLSRFICHTVSLPPAEALRSSLRRWCETTPHIVLGGDRQ